MNYHAKDGYNNGYTGKGEEGNRWDEEIGGRANDDRNDGHDAEEIDMIHDNDHNDEQLVSNEICSNTPEVLDPEEYDDIKSLTNPNEVGDMYEDLCMDVSESSIVPIGFEQACSTLHIKL